MKKPKPYQAECVNALVETHKSGNDRALIVMASGLGKTLTSAFSIREFIAMCHENSRVLFLCHNNEILGKAKTEYRSVFGEEYSYYCQRMGVLAHEMWHVYQEMKASYMDGKNHLYKYNNKNYIDSKDDYAGYRSQLVENEAFYFGDAVKQIVSDPCC